MNTSKSLSAALDRFNADLPENDQLVLNWGREGRQGTWFLHGAFGANLKTGLAFYELSRAVRKQMDEHAEFLANG